MPDSDLFFWVLFKVPRELFVDLTAPACSSFDFYFALVVLAFLLVGLVLCWKYRSRKLFLFPASALVSFALVPAAYFAIPAGIYFSKVSPHFLILQAVFLLFLAYWSRGARPPAFFLALFSMMYALASDRQAWNFYGGCS